MSQMNGQTNGKGCGCECEKPAVQVPIRNITLPCPGISIGIDPDLFPSGCECGTFEKYDLCEFYYFRRPWLKSGFELADGKLLENAAVLYPRAWAFLQTEEGREMCVTEEEWQAMNHATWATLADGTQVGWDGIGGAPFYAPDYATGSLRLPDIRGMYMEAAGYDALDVGGVHGDAIRNITGKVATDINTASSGAFYDSPSGYAGSTSGAFNDGFALNVSRVVPTANKNQTRAWGALGCVYLGAPR